MHIVFQLRDVLMFESSYLCSYQYIIPKVKQPTFCI